MPIQLALIDDNPSLLKSIGRNLMMFEEIDLVYTATDGAMAVQKAHLHRPQVILMDIEMPVMDGIAATAQICRELPHVKVLMLTVFDREDKIFDAVKAGASGYLMKDERPARIVQAVEEVLDGGAPMSAGIALKTLGLLRRQTIVTEATALPLEELVSTDTYALTTREVEILEKIIAGLTPQQIGDQLFISPRTVRKHIENIYGKLHVHSRLEAVRLADQNRWFR